MVPNPDKRLLAGEAVRARVQLATESSTIVVPAQAVRERGDHLEVLVIEAGERVARRRVKSRRAHDGLRVIEEGLAEADLVIVEPHTEVEPGNRVRLERIELDVPG